MKLLYPTLAYYLAFLMFFGSCRSADSLFQKAIEKGLKIDTVWKSKFDSVHIAGVHDTITAEVDTLAILALCRELVDTVVVKAPERVKYLKSKIIPKMQNELCPDIDSTYLVSVASPDTVVTFPVRIIAKGGKLIIEQPVFSFPVVVEEGTTTITPGIGQGRAVLLCVGALIIGMLIGAIAISSRKR